MNLKENPPQPIYTFCRVIPNGHATVGDAVQYAQEVIIGERMAGKWIKKACHRFMRDLVRCDDPDDELEFSIERAEHVLSFFQTHLVHVKSSLSTKAGDPVDLMDWHVFILVNLFGFIKPLRNDETKEQVYDIDEDGNEMPVYIRRFSSAVILVGRKNAKSFIATGIGLYMMCFDNEGGAEVYSAATKRDQAKIVFDDAKEMVEKSKELSSIIKTAKTSIYHVDSYSKFVPLASEADSLDGLNVHLAILDEVHAMKKRDLYDVLETATGSRRQPLILSISTAGTILVGICAELRDVGQNILNLDSPDVGDSMFFLYYTIDRKAGGADSDEEGDHDDEYDESKWYKANPGLGASKGLKSMQDQAEKAKQAPDARANFMTKHLNIFVSGTSAWMDMNRWGELKNANPKNIPYWVGVDMANKIDLCAAVKVYYVMSGQAQGHMVLRCKFWLPEGRLKTCSKSQAELYKSFSERGLLTLTDGDVVDHKTIEDDIYDWINEDIEQFQELAYDPWQATQFALAMSNRGCNIVEVTQTVKNLNEAMVKYQETIYSGKFHHPHDLCYDWMMANVQVKPDKNNNIFPDKSSLENKIDGPAATFNAISRIVRHITDAIMPVVDPDEWGRL